MPRAQLVKRIFDNRATQQRVVLVLACGHYRSVSDIEIATMHRPEEILHAEQALCAACPDPEPEPPPGPTPRQLWREAGEP